MKRLLPLILVFGIMMLGACKEKKKTDDIITTKYVPKKPEPPIAMPEDKQQLTVNWGGSQYAVSVVRTPADSSSMVSDENNQKYFDNVVKVSVNRQDGSSLFNRTFTKGSFLSYIDDSFKKNGILASIRYDEVDDGKLEFSVVIALPDAVDDVFIPLEMTVDKQGVINIRQDNDMEMLDYVDTSEEEDD